MKTFLLWRTTDGRALDPTRVGAELAHTFEPVLGPTEARTRTACGTHLAWIELPVGGFRAPFLEEQGPDWAFAPEYPLNARRLLRAHGCAPVNGSSPLLALGRRLQGDHAPFVRELIPPAALIWTDTVRGEVHVHNDGLGQASLYRYERDGLWALTNRLSALRALGVRLKPVPHEWAVRFTTHWFPQWTSGFEDATLLPGGTHLTLSREAVRGRRFDPVGEWVNPPACSREDALEAGRQALVEHLTDAMELWSRPSVGLSGGWDSRAVASILRSLGAEVELRVRGQETHIDVLVAAELARIAGLPIRIKTAGAIPPGTVEGLRASLSKALLWQSGQFTTLKHKSFLARDGSDVLDGGVVNVMGQHAGIGKGDFAKRIRADKVPAERFEERLLDSLMEDAPPILRAEHLENVRATLRDSYRAAHDYGLRGRGPLHFFFLHEYTRRWGAAAIGGQTGLVVTPFLNPGFVRAAYALPEEELTSRPIHRHVTRTHAPDWADFPYTDEVTDWDLATGRVPPVSVPRVEEPADLPRWRQTGRYKRFHHKFYWKDVGKPLVRKALGRDGFWQEVFDADRSREEWRSFKSGPDILLMAHLLPLVLDGGAP